MWNKSAEESRHFIQAAQVFKVSLSASSGNLEGEKLPDFTGNEQLIDCS
jgi:hypothetical protein